MIKSTSISALTLISLAGVVANARASVVTLNRDSVVPVVFDSALTISDNQVGDRFVCHVDNDPDLPRGTRFVGRIVSIRVPRGNRPASMDLEFTSIELPSGGGARLRGVPIPLGKDLVTTDASGRMYVRNDVRKQGEYVIGGAVGGYLLGSLFHRRITGLLLGTVAGMIAAESDRAKSENVVVDRGARMGALINQDVTLDVNATRGQGSWNRGWDSTRSTGGSGWDGVHHTDSGNRGWDTTPSSPSTPVTTAPSSPVHVDPPTPPAGPPPPPADITIKLGTQTLSFDPEIAPYFDGEVVMVPIEKTAEYLGLAIEKGDKNALYVENADNSIKLEQDSATYRFNGKRASLSRPVTERRGVLFAPVAIFGYLTPKDVVVNGTKLDKTSG